MNETYKEYYDFCKLLTYVQKECATPCRLAEYWRELNDPSQHKSA